MFESFSTFDHVLPTVGDTLRLPMPATVACIYVIRDVYGKVRLAVAESMEEDKVVHGWLKDQANELQRRLGVRAFPPEEAILFLDDELLQELHRDSRELHPGVHFVDRLVSGAGWWSVDGTAPETPIYTLYSVKGGVGRSTTAAVLAWHLARRGDHVLVVDLDLESPGISSAMLAPSLQPDYGVVDWFAEDLVGQGDQVVDRMIARPSWHQDLRGDVSIVPAHGFEPREYLAKLGRVYLDTDPRWTRRLREMLNRVQEVVKPSVVLLESRSGLHDIAAATVTDLQAHVLLFATDSPTNWQDYGILFRHWKELGLATSIRERLSIVSSLTPDIETENYVKHFRERAWALFQDHLYDNVESSEAPYGFAFEVLEDRAPHDPLPIYWTRGFAARASLRDLEDSTVEQAYGRFLERFDDLHRLGDRARL